MIKYFWLSFCCGSPLSKVNFLMNGNDWAIWRKNWCSNGSSSCKDISRTHLNNPPGKSFVILS